MVDHPVLDSEREDGWHESSKYNECNIALVLIVNVAQGKEIEADSESQRKGNEEEGPCVLWSNLQNIVLHRNKSLGLQLFELLVQPLKGLLVFFSVLIGAGGTGTLSVRVFDCSNYNHFLHPD